MKDRLFVFTYVSVPKRYSRWLIAQKIHDFFTLFTQGSSYECFMTALPRRLRLRLRAGEEQPRVSCPGSEPRRAAEAAAGSRHADGPSTMAAARWLQLPGDRLLAQPGALLSWCESRGGEGWIFLLVSRPCVSFRDEAGERGGDGRGCGHPAPGDAAEHLRSPRRTADGAGGPGSTGGTGRQQPRLPTAARGPSTGSCPVPGLGEGSPRALLPAARHRPKVAAGPGHLPSERPVRRGCWKADLPKSSVKMKTVTTASKVQTPSLPATKHNEQASGCAGKMIKQSKFQKDTSVAVKKIRLIHQSILPHYSESHIFFFENSLKEDQYCYQFCLPAIRK